MKRPYYRKTVASSANKSTETVNSMQDLRLRILNIMLVCASGVGLFAVITNLMEDIPNRNWGMVVVTISAYLWILWITIDRKLPYMMRAISFCVLPYMLGTAAQLQFGIVGNSRVWLLGFSALTAIILGLRAGIGAIVVSLITLYGSIILVNMGKIRMPEPALTPETASLMDWISTGSVWLLIAGLVIVTFTMLIQGLTSSLNKERSLSKLLEMDREHLDRRTRELDRRLVQIRTAADVSRSLSGLLDQGTLLQQVVDLMQSRFRLYYVGVFLLDERGENAILRAGTGETGKEVIAEGYQLPVRGDSMIAWAISNRKPRVALNMGREASRFGTPMLSQARSEMALPLISGDRVYGAVTVQSTLPEAFDQDDLIVMQGIADSLATALQNVHLFDESKKSLQEIQALNRQYVALAWKSAGENPSWQQAAYENERYDGRVDGLAAKQFPILLREQVIGRLTLDTENQTFTPEEQTLIQEVTTQAALAMENIRLLEESQRRASLEHLLSEVVQNVRSQTDMEMILRSTVGGLAQALGATDGIIYLTPEFLEPVGATPAPKDSDQNGSHVDEG